MIVLPAIISDVSILPILVLHNWSITRARVPKIGTFSNSNERSVRAWGCGNGVTCVGVRVQGGLGVVQKVYPQNVQTCAFIKNYFWAKVDSVSSRLRWIGILANQGPGLQIRARVDTKRMVSSESTTSKRMIDPWTVLWRHQTVFKCAILISHRIEVVKSSLLPLHNVTIMSVH